MGVYIKGVNYPESCIDCTFLGEDWDDEDTYIVAYCGATDDYREIYDSRKDNRTHEEVVTRKPDWCPLVEIPNKHGDLIDRDEIRNAVFHHLSIKGEENLLPAEKSVFGNIIKAKAVIKAED